MTGFGGGFGSTTAANDLRIPPILTIQSGMAPDSPAVYRARAGRRVHRGPQSGRAGTGRFMDTDNSTTSGHESAGYYRTGLGSTFTVDMRSRLTGASTVTTSAAARTINRGDGRWASTTV